MRFARIALTLIGIALIGAIESPAQLARVPGGALLTSIATPIALEAANHRMRATSTFDLLPLEAGREWVYDYCRKNQTGNSGQWWNYIDSGRVSYVVIGSVPATDTTIVWSVQETLHLLHTQWDSFYHDDRQYWIDTVINLSLVEHTTGAHKLECTGRVWAFRSWPINLNGG